MPKTVIDMPSHLWTRAQALIESGAYSSLSQLCVAAVENQLALESGGEGKNLRASERAYRLEPDAAERSPQRPTGVKRLAPANLPANPFLMPPPRTEDLLWPGITSEEDLYLWGQFNRLLPEKIALRVIWFMSTASNGPEIAVFADEAATIARDIGLRIRAAEDAAGVRRTDSRWAALPVGEQAEKSESRFRMHFTGRVRRDGILDGALFRLKLASTSEDHLRIGLTEAGLAWARLTNPVLDQDDLNQLPLSYEESQQYLRHVMANVPEERRPLSEASGLIASGRATPTTMDVALKAAHPEWTDNMVVTQRAGAISRLWELGLVRRFGSPGSMEFELTDNGEAFLNQVSGTFNNRKGEM